MKHFIRIAIVALLTQVATPQQTGAALQGVVVRAGTSEPLSKALVELRGGGVQMTTTESDGRFFFHNLPPGTYEITVRRDGYTPAEYGQRWPGGPGIPIILKPGQRFAARPIGMTQAAAISGRVSDSNGQPLANAQVQALKSTFQGELRVLLPVQQVRTNASGEFRLYWLPAGRYFVNVVVPGWPGGAQLMINNTGRTDGTAPYQTAGQPRPILAQNAVTNAAAAGPGAPNVSEVGPIYFPSTPYIQSAAPIDLRPGVEFRGLDIHMAPSRKFTICGVVRGIPPPVPGAAGGARGAPPPPPPPPPPPLPAGAVNPNDPCGFGRNVIQSAVGSVQLVPLDVELRAALTAAGNRYGATVDGVSGQFIIRNVLPGRYDLSTFISGMGAAVTVDVRDRDVENATLFLTGGFPLPTRVTVEGQVPAVVAALPGLNMVIGSDPPTQGTSPNSLVSADGVFTIPNVGPRDNRVYVLPLLNSPVTFGTPNVPPALQTAYVKSAKLGGVEVLNTGMRFNGEPDKVLEIVIGTNAGGLAGRVEDDGRQPVPGVFVTLVPNISTARLFRTDMYKTTATDDTGRFEVKGLPPGEYKVFALEGFEKDAWLDPDFFRPYEDRGLAISVGEGKVFTLEAPLRPIRQ